MRHIEIILRKMCTIAGHKYEEIDFKKDGWYSEYTWTEEQEKEFEVWIKNYLYESTEARNQLMSFPHKNKKTINKWWAWFTLSTFKIQN